MKKFDKKRMYNQVEYWIFVKSTILKQIKKETGKKLRFIQFIRGFRSSVYVLIWKKKFLIGRILQIQLDRKVLFFLDVVKP